MKVVLNRRFGGFSLSPEASKMYNNLKGLKGENAIDPKYGFLPYIENKIKQRSDVILVQVVEKLGRKANGTYSELEIINIPDDAKKPYIDEYDGTETIKEGRSW